MIFEPELTDNLLDNVLNTSLNGIVVVESVLDSQNEVVDFRYVFVNQAAREQASVLKSMLVGMTIKEVLAEVSFQSILPICRFVWATGQSYEGERYYAETNEWFKTHFVRLNDKRLVITFTNITSFKQVVLKHQEDAEMFESVLGSSANPVVIGKPIYKNEQEIIDFQLVMFNLAAQEA